MSFHSEYIDANGKLHYNTYYSNGIMSWAVDPEQTTPNGSTNFGRLEDLVKNKPVKKLSREERRKERRRLKKKEKRKK